MTIMQCIVNTLEDLTQTDFRKFCHLLTDRRDNPRIRRRAVEDKSIWEIAELLVSTYTEVKAVQVAFHTLKRMSCNQEAENLKQKTKTLLDKSARMRKTKPSPAKTKCLPTKAKPTPNKTKRLPTKAKPTPNKTKRLPTKAKPTPTNAKPSSTKAKPTPSKAKPTPNKTKHLPTKAKPTPSKAKPTPTKMKHLPTKAKP